MFVIYKDIYFYFLEKKSKKKSFQSRLVKVTFEKITQHFNNIKESKNKLKVNTNSTVFKHCMPFTISQSKSMKRAFCVGACKIIWPDIFI